MRKQVDRKHYEFSTYISKRRWASIWHQLDEVLGLQPTAILEIGPGPGVFQELTTLFGVPTTTLDIDPELKPDYVASAGAMPFPDNTYDVVCAFQMLEHVPFSESKEIFDEMVRVARRQVVISLPDARPNWAFTIHVPKIGRVNFLWARPWRGPRRHIFNGQHYWEINKRGYSLQEVVDCLLEDNSATLLRTYRVFEYPYHRFFIFSCDGDGDSIG